jgi:predicted ATP-grasp superfamily ATP-dependent carboligase
VESAVGSGIACAAADLFADADLARQADVHCLRAGPRELLTWLPHVACDGWMYVGGLENRPRLMARLAAIRPLWGTPPAAVRRVRSPRKLAEFCAARTELGVRFPESYLPHTAPSYVRSAVHGAWLWKPLRGAGGRGVRPFDPAARGVWRGIVQCRLAGRLIAAVYLGNGVSAVRIGISTQWAGAAWTGARPFQYCGSLTPCRLAPRQQAAIDALGPALARQFGLQGLFGVDLVIDEQRVWLLEVNPRATASVEALELATGAPLTAWHVAACRSGWLPASPPAQSRAAGKAILYATAAGEVDRRRSDQWLAATTWAGGSRLADVPSTGTQLSAGAPVLSALGVGPRAAAVETLLRGQLAAIRSRLPGGSASVDPLC